MIPKLSHAQLRQAGLALLVLVVVLLAVVGALTVRACDEHEEPPAPVDTTAIDVSTSKRAAEAAAQSETKIRAIEQEHQQALDTFTVEQEQAYEQVREQGPQEVAKWLTDFNRDLQQKPKAPPKKK